MDSLLGELDFVGLLCYIFQRALNLINATLQDASFEQPSIYGLCSSWVSFSISIRTITSSMQQFNSGNLLISAVFW